MKKKIPTILGIIFLAGGLAVGVLILGQGTGGFLPKASPETTPKSIKITNVTDTTFTVSFLTDTAVTSHVKYGTEENKLNTQVSDDRDQLSGQAGQFTTHHITLRNLQPSTQYFFTINTSGKFTYSDNGSPYNTRTASRLGGAPQALTAYGTVFTNASTPAKDSIVYVSLEGAAPISTLAKSSGSWALPLTNARTADLKSYATVDQDTYLEIFVQGKDENSTSEAKAIVANTQPVPSMTLGETYDYSTPGSTATPLEATPEPASTTGASSKFSSETLAEPLETEGTSTSSGTTGSKNLAQSDYIDFFNPTEEGETIADLRPEIQGSAPPSTTLTIVIESDPVYSDTVVSDADGEWSYTPPADLAPGKHTITVSYTDENGVKHTEQRTFIAQGGTGGTSLQPSFTSTPSATSTPRATATASASPSSSSSGRSTVPSTSSGVPTSGSVEQTFALLIAGFMMILGGLFLWHRASFVKVAHVVRKSAGIVRKSVLDEY